MGKIGKDNCSEHNKNNPANARKTPYTEEEIDGFMAGEYADVPSLEEVLLTSQYGEQKTRERIRAAFVKRDVNNLANMTPKGSIN